MPLWKWSKIAADNGTADSTCSFPEGMSASALNDGARGVMAAVAKYRDDTAGALVTSGTSTAYTVFSNSGFDTLAHMDGAVIAFSPHATNVDTVTLSVDGLAAKPLRSAPGVELVAGTLVQGTPYAALYNNSDGAYYLKGYCSSPYNIPFLGGLDYWDTVTPNSSFIFPMGQAISRTVYSRAFVRWGTKFGAGDGSTTFNVPPKAGRVSVMMESTATLLTSSFFGGDSTAIGAVGGTESQSLTMTQLPASPPTGTIANGAITSTATSSGSGAAVKAPLGALAAQGGGAGGVLTDTSQTIVVTSTQATSTFTGANLGTGAAHNNVQPTIVCNYIMRII